MVIKFKRNPRNERIVKGILKSTFLYMLAVFGILNAIATMIPGKGLTVGNDLVSLLVTQVVSVLVAVVGLLMGTSILIEAHEKEPKKKK